MRRPTAVVNCGPEYAANRHLFAELGERFDRELRIVSMQDIDVAVGIDEFEDRLALGIDHRLRDASRKVNRKSLGQMSISVTS